MSEALQLWQPAFMDSCEPRIQASSFPLAHHLQKVLCQLIGSIEGRMKLTKGSQVCLLGGLQINTAAQEEPKRTLGGVARQRRRRCRFWHDFRLFERLQKTGDHALGARITLSHYFTPQLRSIATARVPAFEDVGSIGIKTALVLAP